MVKIKHVQGNAFKLGIPLVRRLVEFSGGSRSNRDLPYGPLLSGSPIRVIFGLCRAKTAKLVDGYVVVEDKGTLPVGNYHITVLATDGNGDPLRYKDGLVLRIVGSTAEADYSELDGYDGFFKVPVLSTGGSSEEQSTIVVTDDAVELHESAGGDGFTGEITDDAVRMYAIFGTSSIEVDEDSVNIIINQ